MIYLRYEPVWEGVDQLKSNFTIQEHLYVDLKRFFLDHFRQESALDEAQQIEWCSSIQNALTKQNQKAKTDARKVMMLEHKKKSQELSASDQDEKDNDQQEKLRAIPGGRYGCAQFIKICGPISLQSLSLGAIAQMVQRAVQEDLLRYHKTLLIWTNKIKDETDLSRSLVQNS